MYKNMHGIDKNQVAYHLYFQHKSGVYLKVQKSLNYRVKLVSFKSALNPVVYSTDRSSAILTLCCLWSTMRFVLNLALSYFGL